MREFLESRKGDREFSQRTILKKMGISSTGFLANVLSGKQHFTIEQSQSFGQAIGLSPEKIKYFELMVYFARSKKLEEKNEFYESLNVFRRKKLKALSNKQLSLFSKWYYPVLLEILHYFEFDDNYEELGQMVEPSIKAMDVKYAVRELEGMGLLQKDAQGYYRPQDAVMTTGDEVQSFLVKNFQIKMLENEIECLKNKGREEREISGVTIAVSLNDFQKIKKEIQESRKRILQIAEKSEEPEKVFRCHLSAFPVSKSKEGES